MDHKRGNYYAILGIERSASAEEIGRAYRRAARATHPDVHPEEPSAADRFTAITIAYETLADPARRAAYDRAQSAGHPRTRVEPVSRPRATPAVVPIRLGDARRPRVQPLVAPEPVRPQGLHTIPVEDELVELATMLSRLLRAGWRPLD